MKLGRCPNCDEPFEYDQHSPRSIVRCPWCRDRFHPEFIKRPLAGNAERKTEDDLGTGS